MAACVQVTTTLPNEKAAQSLAARLVEERLAACVQVTGPVSSTYRWQGEIEQDAEWYCHIKTTAARFTSLQARIRELHPYEIPEIIALPIFQGDPDYLAWIENSVSGP